MDEEEDLLSISQAAQFLGVSIDTLRRWDGAGKLRAVRGAARGHRYYRQKDLELFASDLVKLAYEWAASGGDIPHGFYCRDSATFQSRLIRMQDAMAAAEKTAKNFSLIVAVAGEIGNNSYDHNLGNWPDVPGAFFGYDIDKGMVALADRGVGMLATLRRVRPELREHKEALKVAFTETVSGREPERRGNGLKFVYEVVLKNGFRLSFQSGDAELELQPHDSKLRIRRASITLQGCFAVVRF